MNSIQNPGQSQYTTPQTAKSSQIDQAVVAKQNQKAAETDLTQQTANQVQEAFKLNISQEAAEMSRASGKVERADEDVQYKVEMEQERPKPVQTPYIEQETSQIVNIVA
ncbi:MAG: hypothetical protein K8R67_06435 [Desulfobacteraceae bacterium]|nr:hypothetical protein [Desulfobacteraceae bacterium]